MGLPQTTQENELEIREDAEVIRLIEETRKGNDDAAEVLLKRYDKALHGNYIKTYINFDFDKNLNPQDREDAYSILNILFMEAVKTYDPTRGKFLTHLTNRIRFKFREYLLKERLMPITHNKAPKEIMKILEKTQCVLHSEIADDMVSLKNKNSFVTFSFQDERIKIPTSIFVNQYLVSNVDKVIPIKLRSLYKAYLKHLEDGTNSPFKVLAKEFKLSINKVHYSIRLCNKIMNKSIKIKDLTFSME